MLDSLREYLSSIICTDLSWHVYERLNLLVVTDRTYWQHQMPVQHTCGEPHLGNGTFFEFTFTKPQTTPGRTTEEQKFKFALFDKFSLPQSSRVWPVADRDAACAAISQRALAAALQLTGVRVAIGALPTRLTGTFAPVKQACIRTTLNTIHPPKPHHAPGTTFGVYVSDPFSSVSSNYFHEQSIYAVITRSKAKKK